MHKPPTGAECTAHSKTNAAQFNARNSLACLIWKKKWQLEPNMLNHEKCITSTNTNTNTHCQAKRCHSSPSSSRGEIVLEPAELTRVLRRSPHKRALRRNTLLKWKHTTTSPTNCSAVLNKIILRRSPHKRAWENNENIIHTPARLAPTHVIFLWDQDEITGHWEGGT